MKVIGSSHRKFKERIALFDVDLIELLFDFVVETHHIFHDSVACFKTVSIIQLVFKGIAGRTTLDCANHLFGHWIVDVGPDRVCDLNVIAKLRLVQHSVLIGLVVACSHDFPSSTLYITRTLNDRLVFNTISLFIDWNTLCVDWNQDLVRVGCFGCGGLKG